MVFISGEWSDINTTGVLFNTVVFAVWIAQIEEHWYGNPEASGSSPGSVKFSLPLFI